MTHYLKDYSRFKKIAEMDAAAEQRVMQHWDELTNSDRLCTRHHNEEEINPQSAGLFQWSIGQVGR